MEKQRELDENFESLHALLEREGGRLTWNELQRIRQYTVNFNPAIEGELRVLTAADRLSEPTGADFSATMVPGARKNWAPAAEASQGLSTPGTPGGAS